MSTSKWDNGASDARLANDETTPCSRGNGRVRVKSPVLRKQAIKSTRPEPQSPCASPPPITAELQTAPESGWPIDAVDSAGLGRHATLHCDSLEGGAARSRGDPEPFAVPEGHLGIGAEIDQQPARLVRQAGGQHSGQQVGADEIRRRAAHLDGCLRMDSQPLAQASRAIRPPIDRTRPRVGLQ